MLDKIAGSDRPPYLGVERSISGRAWRARLRPHDEAQAAAIAQIHGHGDALARVLAGRGVTQETAAAFLDPTLRALMPDPLLLQDMDAAVERLARAVETREQIAIFGDYDVDGATSSALFVEFLEAAGCPRPFLHIPDRILEGYGPNAEAIAELRARGASLLVTLDCGTTSHAALASGRALGLDVIVIDHHQAPEVLPDAIVVNPNRADDLSGLGHLCAAGVAFLALAALARELRRRGHWTSARPQPDLLAGLDLVALATIADVARLHGLNRAFVVKGLAVMRGRARIGLSALLDAARVDGPPRAYHLGFVLGPRINAGGRIGDAALGARLLTLCDPVEAARIAAELDRLNVERQALEKATLEEAEAEADRQLMRSNRLSCLVVAAEGWHPGIVGIVASRLKDKFKIPAFVIAKTGEICSGSGRGTSGVDLGRTVRLAVEEGLLQKGGGHAMAAGVTLASERIEAFRAFMNDALQEDVERARDADALLVDGALTARGASVEFARELERAGPFGAGNPEPLFIFPDHRIVDAALIGASHVRARFQSGDGARLDAIAFRVAGTAIGDALLEGRGRRLHVAARLGTNVFRGSERVETRIVDLAVPDRQTW
ncbi:single-stranded-DNA-specific exonuclease RecJ [Methylosinus sp. H3A]|uniref:single-stranded-DNA-specific exonuclease RecJ n=1 Tax=Methylosinus sp. H3A TaxID=2785786 RepID=UPI0018C21F80|nr:single-stranded-DNA-specific exonuclease RecJ [Methylosinus sp. H3A]MBG0811611.1 single-stranded-DNA-specific exonuclease RecJ [Methylosinus sp. H3A]